MPPVSTSTTRSRDPPEFRELDVHRHFNVTPFALTLYFELIFQVLPTVPCSPSFDFSRRPEISTAAEVPKAHMVPVAATRPRGLHASRLVDSHGVLGGVELERRHVDTHVRPSHLRHADSFSYHRDGALNGGLSHEGFCAPKPSLKPSFRPSTCMLRHFLMNVFSSSSCRKEAFHPVRSGTLSGRHRSICLCWSVHDGMLRMISNSFKCEWQTWTDENPSA